MDPKGGLGQIHNFFQRAQRFKHPTLNNLETAEKISQIEVDFNNTYNQFERILYIKHYIQQWQDIYFFQVHMKHLLNWNIY